jgi:cytochrome c5
LSKNKFAMLLTGILSSFVLFTFTACGGGEGDSKAAAETPKAETKAVASDFSYTDENITAGEAVYQKACIACHAAGIAGAAAITDKARWEANKAKGLETLRQHALNGYTGNYGTMPPKGACADCDENDLKNAILYMLKTSGVID